MRHDVEVSGRAFRLRPLTTADAAFAVSLRTDPERARHLHATSPLVEDQVAWTERYFERDGDWYFVVEHLATGRPEGLVAVYDVDPARTAGEWGRWILRPGSFAALESACLVLDTAFDVIGLSQAVTRTRGENRSVVSFHTSLGAVEVGRTKDVTGDALVEQVMTAISWRDLRPGLERMLVQASRLASRR